MTDMKTISCFTNGLEGLRLGIAISAKWREIKVNMLCRNGETNVEENFSSTGPDSMVAREMLRTSKNKNLFFPSDEVAALTESSIIFIVPKFKLRIVGCGVGEIVDQSLVYNVATLIAQNATGNKIIVECSMIPQQTAELISTVLQSSSRLRFQVLSNPELCHQNSITQILKPERILIGRVETPADAIAVREVLSIYERLAPPENILCSEHTILELSQINSYAIVARRMASIQALAALCNETETDFHKLFVDLEEFAGMDDVDVYSFNLKMCTFENFPKVIDPLCRRCDDGWLREVSDFWRHPLKVNKFSRKVYLDSVVSFISEKRNVYKSVTFFGFYNNTDSLAIDLSMILLGMDLNINIYDPFVKKEEVERSLFQAGLPKRDNIDKAITIFSDPYVSVTTGQIIIIGGNWYDYSALDYSTIYSLMSKPAYIFDFEITIPRQKFTDIGFSSIGILREP